MADAVRRAARGSLPLKRYMVSDTGRQAAMRKARCCAQVVFVDASVSVCPSTMVSPSPHSSGTTRANTTPQSPPSARPAAKSGAARR